MRFLSLMLLLAAASVGGIADAGQGTPITLTTPEEVPTAYHTESGLSGFLVDVAREAFRRSGHKVEFILAPWARCLFLARSGGADGIITLYRTPEREAYLDFSSESVLIQDQAFYVRKGTAGSFGTEIGALADKRIGVMGQVSYGERVDRLIRQGFFSRLDTEPSIDTLVKMLAGGRVDVVPAYRGAIRRIAGTLGVGGQIEELPLPMDALPSYVGFTRARDLSAVKRDFDAGLHSMKADGSYDLLLKRYFPADRE
jgi:polar amino acid transport system substrate-binding protein